MKAGEIKVGAIYAMQDGPPALVMSIENNCRDGPIVWWRKLGEVGANCRSRLRTFAWAIAEVPE